MLACSPKIFLGQDSAGGDNEAYPGRIEAVQINGGYLIKFDDGSLSGGWTDNNLSKISGTLNGLSVGDWVLIPEHKYVYGRIDAINSTNGTYIFTFLSGKLYGTQGAGGWERSHFVKIFFSGKQGDLKKGDVVYNLKENNRLDEVVGFDENGKVFIKQLEGPSTGHFSGNWDPANFAKKVL